MTPRGTVLVTEYNNARVQEVRVCVCVCLCACVCCVCVACVACVLRVCCVCVACVSVCVFPLSVAGVILHHCLSMYDGVDVVACPRLFVFSISVLAV
jgi:hypothetical protein